jgi:hypothetical protein
LPDSTKQINSFHDLSTFSSISIGFSTQQSPDDPYHDGLLVPGRFALSLAPLIHPTAQVSISKAID